VGGGVWLGWWRWWVDAGWGGLVGWFGCGFGGVFVGGWVGVGGVCGVGGGGVCGWVVGGVGLAFGVCGCPLSDRPLHTSHIC